MSPTHTRAGSIMAINPSIYAPATSYSDEVLADSPIAYWRLGDASGTTAADSSGNGHSGTYMGSPTLGVTGLLSGDTNTAVQFAITSPPQAVWITDSAAFQPTRVTVEALVKPASTAAQGYIFSKANINFGFGSAWSFLLIMDAGGSVSTYVFTDNDSSGIHITTAAGTLQAGVTTHLAMTYDGSNIRLYVNGSQVGSAVLTGNLNAASGVALAIGDANASGNPGTGNARFAGVIDEVAFYGTALSSTRIAAHYAAI